MQTGLTHVQGHTYKDLLYSWQYACVQGQLEKQTAERTSKHRAACSLRCAKAALYAGAARTAVYSASAVFTHICTPQTQRSQAMAGLLLHYACCSARTATSTATEAVVNKMGSEGEA